MNWEDRGYLLSKNKYSENSSIVELYTENHGKVLGIVYGATSKKIKNYLQIGNKLHLNYNLKNENKIGYLKIEIDEILTPKFFDDKKKLSSIVSSMSLIKALTADNQINNNIFILIKKLFQILNDNFWINKILFWELELLKLVGYNLELNKIVNEELVSGKKKYFVSKNGEKKYVPSFLVEQNYKEVDIKQISNGFKLVTDYLEKSILKPNNILQPKSRIDFLNLLKE